jgi:hypothetical protein
MTLAEAIRDARGKRGLIGRWGIVPVPMRTVAVQAGVSASAVCRAEQGKVISVGSAVKLARWAGVRMEELSWEQ